MEDDISRPVQGRMLLNLERDLSQVNLGAHILTTSLDDYGQCAEEVGGQFERELGENFVSFFVIGSLARDDVVPGWSDIDSVLVVGVTDETAEELIASLQEEMALKYEFLRSERGSKLSVFPIGCEDLLNCRISRRGFPSALNFHDFRFNSKRIAGRDLSRSVGVPDMTEADARPILSGYLDTLEREANSSAYWKGRNAIISILNTARLSLMIEGVFVTKKRDILKAFTSAFPEGKEIVERAVHLRENWMDEKNENERLEQIYDDGLRFLRRHIKRAEARRRAPLVRRE